MTSTTYLCFKQLCHLSSSYMTEQGSCYSRGDNLFCQQIKTFTNNSKSKKFQIFHKLTSHWIYIAIRMSKEQYPLHLNYI